MNAIELACLLLSALLVLMAIYPVSFKLNRVKYVAQALSFPVLLWSAGAILLLVCVILGVLTGSPFWLFEGILAAILTLANGVQLKLLGFKNKSLPEETAIVVMGWNTLGDSVPVDYLRDAILEQRPDVVSLPETSAEHTAALVATLSEAGYSMRGYTVGPQDGHRPHDTSLLVSAIYGEYQVERINTLEASTLAATPINPNAPILVAVHTVAPNFDQHAAWIQNLQDLAARYRQASRTILVGDFNATNLHMQDLGNEPGLVLGALADAAAGNRNAGYGTWPLKTHAVLGTQIDHVMHTRDYEAVGFRVLSAYDDSGSDHRAIIAQLMPMQD